MRELVFCLARPEHARAIWQIKQEISLDLTAKLGVGHWSKSGLLQSIRERIELGDPDQLRKKTLYAAISGEEVVGVIAVSTWPPGFWKRSLWSEPQSPGLGVFDLCVSPALQRQGIGRFLMESTEQLARTRSILFVRLDAYVDNPYSTAFYRHIGYQERGLVDVRGVGLVLFEKETSLSRRSQ